MFQVGLASAHASSVTRQLKTGPAVGIEGADLDMVQECTDGVLARKSARHKRGNRCHDLDVEVEGLYGRKSRLGKPGWPLKNMSEMTAGLLIS